MANLSLHVKHNSHSEYCDGVSACRIAKLHIGRENILRQLRRLVFNGRTKMEEIWVNLSARHNFYFQNQAGYAASNSWRPSDLLRRHKATCHKLHHCLLR
jgi:hypothetical protein